MRYRIWAYDMYGGMKLKGKLVILGRENNI